MTFVEALPLLMFAALAILLFSGYPVAFVLGGIGLGFAFLAIYIDPFLFDWPQFGAIPSRIFGSIAENLILTAIPMFIFMGTMLERSGVARDLLNCLQVLLRRVPGGLALAVTIMGTILAATTGIIGASVVMMTLLALPVMQKRGYAPTLSTGTIAASGTLGILIPPSIMLVIMADLLGRSVGNLFVAAVIPGFMLSVMYCIYIMTRCTFNPALAPKLPADMGPQTRVVWQSWCCAVLSRRWYLSCWCWARSWADLQRRPKRPVWGRWVRSCWRSSILLCSGRSAFRKCALKARPTLILVTRWKACRSVKE